MVLINYITHLTDVFTIFIKNVKNPQIYYSTNNIVQKVPPSIMESNKKLIEKANYLLNNYMKKELCYNNQKDVWNICLTQNDFMFNLPFTLGDIIFMPLYYNIENMGNNQLLNTFIHEQIHIYQRYNSNTWNNTIEKTTKWRRGNIKSRGILNPDIYYMPYTYNNKYYAYLDYNNGKMKTKWIDIKTEKDIDIDYKYEHPYEMLAYKLTDEIMKIDKK